MGNSNSAGQVGLTTDSDDQDVLSVLHDIQAQMSTMKRDVDRRLDELSMEINATSQLVGMSEDTTKKHFAEIVSSLNAISEHDSGNVPMNAGIELDAVVQITEDAATRILDAADRIASRLNIGCKQSTNNECLKSINADLQEIFLACEFQDITSQRIRNTLANLQRVEDRLVNTLDRLGIEVGAETEVAVKVPNTSQKANSQSEIDNLFD